METKVKVMETSFEEFGVLVLEDNEAIETDGGDHYEWINGELILVKD